MYSGSKVLQKIKGLSWSDRILFTDCVIWLGFARLAIALLPFSFVARFAAMRVRSLAPAQEMHVAELRRIRMAVLACARRVPWRAACFQQGLAAQIMLRRRGIPSVLYYGAASDNRGGLSAHVWVRCGDFNVVGGEIASRFAVLATFPLSGNALVGRGNFQ